MILVVSMKRLILLCFAALGGMALSAQGVRFKNLSFEEAMTLAIQEDKPIFVDVYTVWCGPCRRMSREVFMDKEVSDYFNANYICLKLDAENESGHGFFSNYVPSAYPSFYWLTPQGDLLASHSGYLNATDLLEVANKAEKSTLNIRLKDLERRWADGERSESLLREYLFQVLPQVDPTKVRPLLNDYLEGLPTDSLASRCIGEMIQGYSRTLVNDKVCRTFLEYSDSYRQCFGKMDFDKIMYTLLVRIPMADKRTDNARYLQDCELIRSMTFPHKAMFLQLLDIEEYLLDKKYAKGLSAAFPIVEGYAQEFPYLYAELCYTLVITGFFKKEYTPSGKEGALCLQLAEKAFELTPSQCTLAYLAAAYARVGNFQKAYELVMYLPFYEKPTLSNAVYGLLNLQRPK